MAEPTLVESVREANVAGQALRVSVVVPVRGSAEELRGLLEALERQTLEPDLFEVIVADDGSDDECWDGLASDESPRVRVSSGPPLNSYAARNRAALIAQAPVLAFCDSDCVPTPSWLACGLEAVEDHDLAAGLVRMITPERHTIWSLLDLDTFLDQERAVRAGTAVTANLFVRREIYDRVGGFDDAFPNQGDHDFVNRAVTSDASLVFAPKAAVSHPTRDNAGSFLRKVWRVNRAYAARETRAGRLPRRLRPRNWIPLVPTVMSRRYFGRSLRLDRRRLAASGVSPSPVEEFLGLLGIYLLIPYASTLAQLRGWWMERR